jgi:hypothetical protein
MIFNQQLFFIPISANAEIKKIVEKNCPIDEITVTKRWYDLQSARESRKYGLISPGIE